MPLVPPAIAALEAYTLSRTPEDIRREFALNRVVKLSSNENPLGASPRAVRAMQDALAGVGVYPSGGLLLRGVLARKFDVKVANVIAGSGSEGIMSNIIRTFLCDDDEVLTADATFMGFPILAKSRGVIYRTVPLREWRFDLQALADAVTEHTKIIYLANPNNPTGTMFTRQEFDAFHGRIPPRVLIILDEAYFEYAAGNPRYPDSMHYRCDNVITLRTFSKAYGLAGARIGYGFAHEDLIANLLKVKLPFEPSGPAEAGGIAALDDLEFLHQTLAVNARGMEMVSRELRAMGIEVIPSAANFVMTVWPSAGAAGAVFESLLRQGVITRPLHPFGVPNGLRITIGLEEQNEILLEAMWQAVRQPETALCR